MLVAVLPQHDPTQAAYAASIGVIVAGISQAALLLVGRAQHRGAHPSEHAPAHAGDPRPDPPAWCRGVIASSATQINLFISAMLASPACPACGSG